MVAIVSIIALLIFIAYCLTEIPAVHTVMTALSGFCSEVPSRLWSAITDPYISMMAGVVVSIFLFALAAHWAFGGLACKCGARCRFPVTRSTHLVTVHDGTPRDIWAGVLKPELPLSSGSLKNIYSNSEVRKGTVNLGTNIEFLGYTCRKCKAKYLECRQVNRREMRVGDYGRAVVSNGRNWIWECEDDVDFAKCAKWLSKSGK